MCELIEVQQSPNVIRPELLGSLLPTALTCEASTCMFRAKGSPTLAKKMKLGLSSGFLSQDGAFGSSEKQTLPPERLVPQERAKT